MITANLSSYCWAANLHQWIPYYTRTVELEINRWGNLKVISVSNPYNQNKMGKISEMWVFDKEGKCISHKPSKRAILAGAEDRWNKLYNINYGEIV